MLTEVIYTNTCSKIFICTFRDISQITIGQLIVKGLNTLQEPLLQKVHTRNCTLKNNQHNRVKRASTAAGNRRTGVQGSVAH